MTGIQLTPEQEVEAQRIAEIVGRKVQEETLQIARMMMSRRDEELLGKSEFDVRERVHEIGAHVIETAVNERKKGGTTGRA